jgi:phenylacetate-coenzyme A ligase PaaK-like adenylate-forming protein
MQRSLRRMESASAEDITRYQERRLRAMVKVAAARSPFYRDWFAGSGTDPSSIRTLDDLGALPLLRREDLVERPERFRVYPRRLMWTAQSSGTSGSVVTVYRTPGSSVFELSALERQWGWFGLPPRPRRVTVRAAGPDPSRDGAVSKVIAGSQQMVVSSYTLGASTLSRLLADMRAFEPQAIEGWPSSISLLASLLRDRGERFPVAGVITSSEVMTTQQITLMEEVFCAPVIDHYGQTERVTMAGQCQAGGYHLFPDYSITELLPVEGRPGRWEIVGTPLHNWGFPLFRYRTGDEVGQAPRARCPCGRAFPLIGVIDGRVEDSFTSSTGRVLPMPSLILDDLLGVREAQIAQLAPGRFEIRMVPTAATDLEGLRTQALRNVERYFGTGQTVSFRVLERIPRARSGKLKPAVLEAEN